MPMPHQFTQAEVVKGATATNLIRRAKRSERALTAAYAYTMVDELGRDGVTMQSVEATLRLGHLIASHKVSAPESASELAEVAKAYKIAHTIMRLEHNESTSNSAYREAATPADLAALAEKVQRLQDGESPTPDATTPEA